MKNISSCFISLALALSLGALDLSAQSPDPLVHAGRSVTFSGAASGEAVASVGDSTESALRVASGIVAVPLWVSGAAVKASGAASTAAGHTTIQGANKIWDFATGDASARPPLNRSVGVPAPKVSPPKDPTPAEALNHKL